MLGQGFVKNYHALAGCRALLGAFEAGFFPGCVYLITWYVVTSPKHESDCGSVV